MCSFAAAKRKPQVYAAQKKVTEVLVYAAHDVRHMLTLRRSLESKIIDAEEWMPRIREASQVRGAYCMRDEYKAPGAEAPEF